MLDRPATARPPQHHDPTHRHAGHPEDGAERHRDQHRLADIGLQEQKHDADGVETKGDRDAGDAFAFLSLREHPGHQDDQRRLEKLRGLQGEAGNLDPAGRALGGVAKDRQRDHGRDGGDVDEEGDPAHAFGREHGHGQQGCPAAKREKALSDREVKRPGDVEPLGGGGAGPELQQDAQSDQDGGEAQQDVIGRPPPKPHRRPVGPGEGVRLRAHAEARLAAGWARAWTALRKSSPRSSKSAYWSKEAQAGEKSTTASSPVARASANAARTAASRVRDSTNGTRPPIVPANSLAASPIR